MTITTATPPACRSCHRPTSTWATATTLAPAITTDRAAITDRATAAIRTGAGRTTATMETTATTAITAAGTVSRMAARTAARRLKAAWAGRVARADQMRPGRGLPARRLRHRRRSRRAMAAVVVMAIMGAPPCEGHRADNLAR